MNYLWEVALKADDCQIPRESLRYIEAEICSPYIEASFIDLNTDVIDGSVVEVNPLYRFSAIFSAVFNINFSQSRKLREMLFDVCMHYIIQIDLRQGMTKSEYYLRFILRDVLNGAYGQSAAAAICLFTLKELRHVLTCMLSCYKCAESIYLFRKLMRGIYPDSLVYSSNDIFREILIYIGVKETEEERSKIDFIIDVFLPKDYTTHLFWEHHFGIIDVEVTMQLDEMVLF